jgi:putative transposase
VHAAAASGGLAVGLLCESAGVSRQNYYKLRKVRQRLWVDEALVLELVSQQRALQPKLGARKLLRLISDDLADAGVKLGRDRLFGLLERHDLLIERRASRVRTTNSLHGYGYYPNLAKEAVLTGPHQLLLSDITYLRTQEGFMYLCLVSDAFSRMIVGFDCSDSLERDGALRALGQALRQLPASARAMHHSDRGCQYCCGEYIQTLNDRGVAISMTELNHCYENAQAERLNGILKQEYGLGGVFARKHEAPACVREAVMLFNTRRPHTSLGYRVPMDVHRGVAAA